MKIQVHELVRHFDRVRAVDGISFAFQSGQIYGFIGPNGAGKTTTMRIMATLDEPTCGDVLLDGWSVVQQPEQARRYIGFMPDTLPTHRDIDVHDYLDFFARAFGLPGRRRRVVLDEIEQFTGLTEWRNKPLRALSKGMKQRVSLARALVHDPEVLILDEPAAGLDPRARIEIRELIRILARQGKAVLISSHILIELSEICDGAVIIDHGRILRAGPIDQILQPTTPQRQAVTTVVLRLLQPVPDMSQTLLTLPGVLAVRQNGQSAEVDVEGLEPACHQLLKQLIHRDWPVCQFHRKVNHLEDLFMNLTNGQS